MHTSPSPAVPMTTGLPSGGNDAWAQVHLASRQEELLLALEVTRKREADEARAAAEAAQQEWLKHEVQRCLVAMRECRLESVGYLQSVQKEKLDEWGFHNVDERDAYVEDLRVEATKWEDKARSLKSQLTRRRRLARLDAAEAACKVTG